jgi:ACS family tartrate transporter-like MFS transporter
MDVDQAARSAIAKAARRLLPFLCLCYAVNFLDRVNVGFAALSQAFCSRCTASAG